MARHESEKHIARRILGRMHKSNRTRRPNRVYEVVCFRTYQHPRVAAGEASSFFFAPLARRTIPRHIELVSGYWRHLQACCDEEKHASRTSDPHEPPRPPPHRHDIAEQHPNEHWCGDQRAQEKTLKNDWAA